MAATTQKKIMELEVKMDRILELLENQSQFVRESEKAMQNLRKSLQRKDRVLKKTLNEIKQDIGEQKEQEQKLAEKLDLMENEIRMLLINSVTELLPK